MFIQPDVCGVHLQSCLSVTELALQILQTITRHYIRVVDFRIYQLAIRSARYDNAVSCYIAKTVKKVESQMKAHFFDPDGPFSIIGFSAPF